MGDREAVKKQLDLYQKFIKAEAERELESRRYKSRELRKRNP